MAPGFVSNLEWGWQEPSLRRYLERLASFSRLILFDKRGTGLSDPVPTPATLEERVDDLRAVMDAAGAERPAPLGVPGGGGAWASGGGGRCVCFPPPTPPRGPAPSF